MARWLLKTEPDCYSWDDLVRDKTTAWDGVTNALASETYPLDEEGGRGAGLPYRRGAGRGRRRTVASNPYPDPKGEDERHVVVDLKAGKRLPRPVTLSDFKADPAFAGWDLLRDRAAECRTRARRDLGANAPTGRRRAARAAKEADEEAEGDFPWLNTAFGPNGRTLRLAVSPAAAAAAAGQHAVGGDDFTGDEPHLPHKPADDTEQIYFEGSPMLRAEIGRGILWILLGAMVIAAPIAWSVWKHHTLLWWVYLACVIVGLVMFLIPWLRVKSIRYRISNYRINFERGLIGKSIDTLELWHVEDVRVYQSILDRILGVGSITVISHDDTTPHLLLRGLPNPRPLFDSVKQRIIAVKRQRGVVKMDTGS